VYAEWEQDETGFSEDYGCGGICDDVAQAICNVLQSTPGVIDCKTWHISDDNHTAAVAKTADGVWLVDVPPHVYEDGSWYNYKKKPDIHIGIEDVVIERLDADPQKFDDYEDR